MFGGTHWVVPRLVSSLAKSIAVFISPSHGEQIEICFDSNQGLSKESKLGKAWGDDAMGRSKSTPSREKTTAIPIGEYLKTPSS